MAYGGRQTALLDYNAPAEPSSGSSSNSLSVKEALEALPGVSIVEVSRNVQFDSQDGATWLVTFYDTGDV